MLKAASLLACLLAVLAGCSTDSRRVHKAPPPDWEVPGANTPAPVPTPLSTASAPRPAPAPVPVPAPVATWLPLDRWARQHGFGPIRRLALAPLESYALPTSNGVLVVGIGSLSAYWDGCEFRLGFAPQVIDGQVFLHSLDVRKNLESLSHGFPGFTNAGRVIVLDPGHGGANPGAQSVVDGHYEKEFTLDWAQRVAPLLEQEGWRVFLTRTNDTDISLDDRIAFAERHNADVFVSLHFNSLSPNPEPAGVETFCLTPTGMRSSLTRGYADDSTQVFPNNVFDEQNLQLAMQLHRALLTVSGNADRAVRRARFLRVLREQNRPAALVEGGFLSNPGEARLIADPRHRQRLAEAIAKALE